MNDSDGSMATISSLKSVIYSVLEREISGRECCLLDLPNYYNPGDHLIRLGDSFLVNNLSCRVTYESSLHFFNPKMVSKNSCILLQGGGGFGDLYYKHQRFRERIIQSFPDNKIIILPSTVYFSSLDKLRRSVEIFSRHKNLVICARDKSSFSFLKNHFHNSKNYLVPDVAFAIENIPSREHLNPKKRIKRVLYLCRNDKEKKLLISSKNLRDFLENVDIADWPTQKLWKLCLHKVFFLTNQSLLMFLKFFGSHWNSRYDVYGLLPFHSTERQIRSAINFLSKYDLIITTRLHGHILSSLLGIPNIILDNSYKKNKNFYATWMQNNSLHVYYADSLEDIKRVYKNLTRDL